MATPSPSAAAAECAAIISSYCGRDPGSGQLQACGHDHLPEAQVLVDKMDQTRSKELLSWCLAGPQDEKLADRIKAKLQEIAMLSAPPEPR